MAAMARIKMWIRTDRPEEIDQTTKSSDNDGHLRKKHGLAALIRAFGKLLDICFDARNLIARFCIGHPRSFKR